MKAMLVAAGLALMLIARPGFCDTSQEALRAAAAAEKPRVVETLKALVEFETGFGNAPGLAGAEALLSARLRELGAAVESVSAQPSAGNALIGRIEGKGSRAIMLMAHYDTVYPPGTLAKEPFRLDGSKAYGPGIADAKGGIAVILHALRMLRQGGFEGYKRVTVVFNPDEEIGSRGSGALITRLAREHDTVLSFEPTFAGHEAVLTGAAGTATGFLEVKGKAAHAGVEPQNGRNALIELAHQLLQLDGLSSRERGVQMHWTLAQAGEKSNVIPDSAKATADIRITDPKGVDWMRQQVEERIRNKRIADTVVSFRIDVGRPAFKGDERTQHLVQLAKSIYGEIGRELNVDPMTGGATDAGYAQAAGNAAVLESMALPGAGFHAKQEWVDMNAIEPRLYLSARMIIELSKP